MIDILRSKNKMTGISTLILRAREYGQRRKHLLPLIFVPSLPPCPSPSSCPHHSPRRTNPSFPNPNPGVCRRAPHAGITHMVISLCPLDGTVAASLIAPQPATTAGPAAALGPLLLSSPAWMVAKYETLIATVASSTALAMTTSLLVVPPTDGPFAPAPALPHSSSVLATGSSCAPLRLVAHARPIVIS